LNRLDFRSLPFLRIIIPAVAGVALGDMVDLPVWLLGAAFVLVSWAGWALRRTGYASAYLWAAIFLLYMMLSTWSRPATSLPYGQRVVATAEILDDPFTGGRWGRCEARVTAFRPSEPDGQDGQEDVWHSINERVLLSVDTSYLAAAMVGRGGAAGREGAGADRGSGRRLMAGDKVAYTGYFNPVGEGDYGNLMTRRGLTARSYITSGNLLYLLPPEGFSWRRALADIKRGASERLSRLGVGPREEAVLQAMVLGRRELLTPEIRDNYARSGTAHLLAVAGLHLGIVFLFVNALLWFVPLFRRGHIVKNVLAIAAVWFYALLTGLSPSVVRAAFMFSGVQVALATSSRSHSLNTLLATAAVMLAISPNSLWDVSFQLSFTAVLFIMLWCPPLYRLVRTRWAVVNFILGAVVISVVAMIGTAPLVAYHFGYFSISGIVVNPVVTTLAYGILILPIVWIMLPLSFLRPIIHWPVEWALRLQNSLTHWGAAQSWGVIYASPSPLWIFFAYGVLLLATPFVLRLGDLREREDG